MHFLTYLGKRHGVLAWGFGEVQKGAPPLDYKRVALYDSDELLLGAKPLLCWLVKDQLAVFGSQDCGLHVASP